MGYFIITRKISIDIQKRAWHRKFGNKTDNEWKFRCFEFLTLFSLKSCNSEEIQQRISFYRGFGENYWENLYCIAVSPWYGRAEFLLLKNERLKNYFPIKFNNLRFFGWLPIFFLIKFFRVTVYGAFVILLENF